MTAVPNTPIIHAETLPAGEDLSDKQFYFVKRDGDTYIACDAITDLPDGVLQNDPELGEPCYVIGFGGTKVVASEALSVGDLIGTAADGRAAPRTANHAGSNYITGRGLSAVSNGDEIAAAIVNCFSVSLGA